jgi:hypothetical protein
VTPELVDVIQANAGTEPARLVARLFAENPMVPAGEAYFWDPLAAAVALGSDVVRTEDARIAVVTTDGVDLGRTRRSDDGHAVAVAVEVDARAFEELLVRTLAGLPDGADLAAPPEPVAEATVSFDGTTCSYDGPTTVPAGRLLLTFRSTVEGSGAAIVHLTGELSIDEIIAHVAANPADEDPPGVADLTFLDPGGPTRVDVVGPAVAIACSAEQAIPVAGPTVTVG